MSNKDSTHPIYIIQVVITTTPTSEAFDLYVRHTHYQAYIWKAYTVSSTFTWSHRVRVAGIVQILILHFSFQNQVWRMQDYYALSKHQQISLPSFPVLSCHVHIASSFSVDIAAKLFCSLLTCPLCLLLSESYWRSSGATLYYRTFVTLPWHVQCWCTELPILSLVASVFLPFHLLAGVNLLKTFLKFLSLKYPLFYALQGHTRLCSFELEWYLWQPVCTWTLKETITLLILCLGSLVLKLKP